MSAGYRSSSASDTITVLTSSGETVAADGARPTEGVGLFDVAEANPAVRSLTRAPLPAGR